MKRNRVICDCERGGNCNKTTLCAIDSALQDQTEEFEDIIRFEIQSFRDGYAPDPVPHDLGVFMEAIEKVLSDE